MKTHLFFCNTPPKKLILELTSRCNLHCHMCISHSSLKNETSKTGKDLEDKIIKKITPIIKELEIIELGGLGEPLFTNNFCKKILEFRKINPKLKIVLFTNGIMLKNDLIRETVLKNIDYLQISINGVGQSYEHNMGNASWETMLQNLALLENEKKKPWIALGYIVMKNNWHSLFKLLFIAKKYSIQEIALKDLWISFPQLQKQSIRKNFFLESIVFLNIALLYLFAHILKITLTTYDLPYIFPLYRKKQNTCTAPWEQIQVNTDGEVLLCCNGRTVIGNLHKRTMAMIWNSSKALNYRKGITDKRYYKECKKCKILIGRTTKALFRTY